MSYSHRDRQVANWLHRALETYRLPPHMIAAGKAERLRPIFKDRDELPASDSLGDAIESAIRSSDALIVLCSPAAAASPWIAREVDLYKRIHGDRGVMPVVVEGEPPGNFPAPLLVHYENGEPTDREAEPIAADMRPEADGRKLAKLKLVAGLAGVDLDHLVQRDAARRQRKLVMVAGASALGMIGTTALSAYAIDQRNEAREQRAEADGLIEYMLTDLRKQLEPVGRLELLDGVGKRAMDYYARQKLADLSATELGRRARATMLVAEVQNLRGNNADALPAFRQAARTTAELLERKPDDPERMFNHGQSLFWVGYIAWQHGRLGEARKAMEEYADISHRLAAKDRSNLAWQMEEAYSLSNLGTMAKEAGELASALDYFRRNVELTEIVSVKEGRPVAREIEIAGGLSWVASTLQSLGRMGEALEARRKELAILDRVVADDPANIEARKGRIFSLANIGQLEAFQGDRAAARKSLDAAIADFDRVLATDRENTLFKELGRSALRDRALLAWSDGDDGLARRQFDRLEAIHTGLIARDPKNYEWTVSSPAVLDLQRALTDRSDLPAAALHNIADKWEGALDAEDPDLEFLRVASRMVHAVAYRKEGDTARARKAYAAALAVPETKRERVDFRSIALRAVAAEKTGQPRMAAQLRARLKKMGIDPLIDDRL